MNNGYFNAQEYTPNQGTPKHPVGKFPFRITNTEVKPGRSPGDSMLAVTLSSPQGNIVKNYNVVFAGNADTQRIAREQLSALCHATGIFQLNFATGCRELQGGQGVMDVGEQANNPQYNEVKTVYDLKGDMPKAGAAPAQAAPQQPAPPMQPPAFAQPPAQSPTAGPAFAPPQAATAPQWAPAQPPAQEQPPMPSAGPYNAQPQAPQWGQQAPAQPAWANPGQR